MDTNRVFEIFENLTEIPRGSENMSQIASFCVDFAENNGLNYLRDGSDNIIIFKPATIGMEDREPVILQGHLDMVCQQTSDSNHDFSKKGPEIIYEGDFIKANKTTLGADNGIAVAIIMAILESKDLAHPPIEAVFTTDEEIGMIGALALDTAPLKSKRLINLDSEEDDVVTVSCAGGSEFQFTLPITFENTYGYAAKIKLFGLKGGHSGVEIDKGRINANILAGRLLNHLKNVADFTLCSINGGDKSNAITPANEIHLSVKDRVLFLRECESYLSVIKSEIFAREPDFQYEIIIQENKKETIALSKELSDKIIFLLTVAPNGIINMSAEIDNLVETSLNLGILKTLSDSIIFDFSLRSNKNSVIIALEEKLSAIAENIGAKTDTFGHYPPWEYKANSDLQELYCKCFKEHYGFEPKIEAIHAGLECGVFSSKIQNLSCIAVGPTMFDVHTVNERLSISSVKKFCELIFDVISRL